MYNHLSNQDRIIIGCLLEEKKPLRYIADKLGRSVSTICREIRRNRHGRHRYEPLLAQRKADNRRRKASGIPRKLTEAMLRAFDAKMEEHASVISAAYDLPICATAFYNWLWRDACVGSHMNPPRPCKKARKRAPHKYMSYGVGHYGKRKARKGFAPMSDAMPIAVRPEIVDAKTRLGDLEVDTMYWQKDVWSLTIRDRKSSMVWLRKLPVFTADAVAACIKECLLGHDIKTITSDRGVEFIRWRESVDALVADWFVCDPGRPQQRGGVEHANGIVRRMVESEMSECGLEEALRRAEKRINNRPTKRLGFRTPAQVFGL